MTPARIAELIAPFFAPPAPHAQSGVAKLSASQLQQISTYIDMLIRWNARMNLTAIRDPEQIVTRHFGESLFAARHLFPLLAADRDSTALTHSVADVGSGAGFPGLPIKIWAPDVSLTLVDSNQKKTVFLREVARALTLTNVNIQSTRAELLPPGTYEVVTLRAVERFEHILPTTARLVAPGGRLALLISSPQLDKARQAISADLGFSWSDPSPVPLSSSRLLVAATRSMGQAIS
jgi:16S rRNA (guanine527-N7)-methyltransferase